MSIHPVKEKLSSVLYPLRFRPILFPVIWGGQRILEYKGLSPTEKMIGESWELSPLESNCSIVANGTFSGCSFIDLMDEYAEAILGKKYFARYGKRFPLLIKLLDASKDLSIQVHPGHKDFLHEVKEAPKNEMWYLLDSLPQSRLCAGFKQSISAQEYLDCLEKDCIPSLLQYDEVEKGDLYFIPSGCVHTIGAGCFILEVQEPSDTTYRIYDYGRRDAQGNKRELHTEQALKVLNFTAHPPYKLPYKEERDKLNSLLTCDYFRFYSLPLSQDYILTEEATSSACAVLFVEEGELSIIDIYGQEEILCKSDLVLLPACLFPLHIKVKRESKVLLITLPE